MNLSDLRERAEYPLATGKMKLSQTVVLALLDRIEEAEGQLATKDAQIAVLVGAIGEHTMKYDAGADGSKHPHGVARNPHHFCGNCGKPWDKQHEVWSAALTPDLVSLAADYRDALAVRERVRARDWFRGTVGRLALHSDSIEAVRQAILGKEPAQ